MPGYHKQVPGGVASFEAFYAQAMPKQCIEDTVLWDRRWCYQRRSPDTHPQWDQSFLSTGCWWPMMKSWAVNDPAAPITFMEAEQPGLGSGQFVGWEYGLGGNQSRKFILGQCKQASGDPFGGAEVQAYRTSDYLYVGNGYADDKGRYEVGCPNTPNDAHYLVAYSTGTPAYAGTSVNTIVPTWRDGT